MQKKSVQSKVVRTMSKDVSAPSKADLARLREAMRGQIDTCEIAEKRSFSRLQRGPEGELPRPSMIRDAIEGQRRRRNITVYALWQKARVFHPSLSQAAVHEFLKGQRQLELPSAEALLAAADLKVVRAVKERGKSRRGAKARSRRHVG